MKNSQLLLISVVCLLITSSCNNSKLNEFLIFNKKDNNVELIKEGYYIVLPLNSCNSCFNEVYGELIIQPDKEIDNRIGIIIVGDTRVSVQNFGDKILFKNVYFDIENFLSKNYNFGNQYPSALKVSNFKLIEKTEISPNNINLAKRILRNEIE